ncbi:pleckstrin homology domain-containing family m member 3 [Plakobranchus ocellatus]|uniref:Pleckstrin homology domain-containing family m member 3 n=1 Tax=Plakobranchus ocellatus TaxID=259542 RepID=A0AAV4DDU9_9GAST|nr:pleckstrin homology domain-containing family m member 3 [Plakobranchus ocellatus]
MFRRNDQDNIHHANIKRGITSHFARMLKILQQKHIQQADSEGDEFVYSNDESNNLCSALEAVFLHGLKPPVTQKLSTYVGWTGSEDTSVYLNFWAVAEKFTHKNVISYLKSLRQITTEIGLCRAWIRLALNDGLMESYLHSVVVDEKSLKYFYRSSSYLRDIEQPGILKNYLTALNDGLMESYLHSVVVDEKSLKYFYRSSSYLRDIEQPGILKNYLTGLMSLTFSLSLNSSVLNDWNNSTLQLINNLSNVPAPIIRQVNTATQERSSGKVLHRRPEEQKSRNPEDPEPIVASRSSSITSNQSRGETQAMFSSIRDVEAIRRIIHAPSDSQVSYTPSDCSSSSLTSCPDPSGRPLHGSPFNEILGSPHLYPRPSQLPEKPPEAGDVKILVDIADDLEKDFATQLALSPPRPRSRKVTEKDAEILSPRSSVSSDVPIVPTAERHFDFVHQGSDFQPEPKQRNVSPSPRRSQTGFADENLVATPPSQASAQQKLEKTGHSSVHPSTSNNDIEPYDDIYAARVKSPSPSASEERTAKEKSFDELCAGLPAVKLDPLVQDAILKKVLGEIDKQADRDREARDLADSWKAKNILDQTGNHEYATASKLSTSPSSTSLLSGKSNINNPVQLQRQVLQDIQDNDPNSILEDKQFEQSSDTITNETLPASQYVIRDCGQKVSDQSGTARRESDGRSVEGEASEEEYGSGRFGNSLSSMMGWSSDIDPKQKPRHVEPREDNSRTESFASMLRSYMPGLSAQEPAVTLDQVIENLPGEKNSEDDDHEEESEDEKATGKDNPDGGLKRRGGSSKTSLSEQKEDSSLDDFEVLRPPSDSVCGQVEANSTQMIFLFRVPQEHGLSHQNFTCRGCSRPIGMIYGQPRKCSFDGGLYCYECHENMETYIPSSIVFDWDFRKKKVCTENYKFLTELESQALYDIEELNPKLYKHLPEMGELKILRERLCYLKSYLFTCSQKMAESLRQKVWPREHLYDRRDLYSITDLLQVQAGTLQRLIKDLVKYSSQHVYSCVLCSQKGYVCEICRNARIIYPFEVDTTVRCERCKAVYHKTCMTESLPCPKCERWGRRSNSNIMDDHPEDYGISPDQIARPSQHSATSLLSSTH